MKIISIDPSGNGTTAICLVEVDKDDNRKITFDEYKSENWEQQLNYVTQKIEEEKADFVAYENTSYVYARQHQGTVGLYKLIGGIVGLKRTFGFIKEIEGVYVSNVKAFRDEIRTNTKEIEGLIYQEGRGKGWKYNQERISLHKVDALIVYHLWAKENLPERDKLEVEIAELRAKGKKTGAKQKVRLEKLERILKTHEQRK